MPTDADDRILKEICRRVIARDAALQDQLKQQHRVDASLEALKELTARPAAEIERIPAAGRQFTAVHAAKFLCGIDTPAFMRLKARRLPHFGALQQYPFPAVKQWAAGQMRPPGGKQRRNA